MWVTAPAPYNRGPGTHSLLLKASSHGISCRIEESRSPEPFNNVRSQLHFLQIMPRLSFSMEAVQTNQREKLLWGSYIKLNALYVMITKHPTSWISFRYGPLIHWCHGDLTGRLAVIWPLTCGYLARIWKTPGLMHRMCERFFISGNTHENPHSQFIYNETKRN